MRLGQMIGKSVKRDRSYTGSLESLAGCSGRSESGRNRNTTAVTPARCGLAAAPNWPVRMRMGVTEMRVIGVWLVTWR